MSSCPLHTFCSDHSSLLNSSQGTSSHSKRPKNEEDKEMSAAVSGAEGPTCDPDPDNVKVSVKPEAAAKLGNTEALPEEEVPVSRMQLDENSSGNVRLSGEKLAGWFTSST